MVGDLKVHLFPTSEAGQIMVRVENVADLFDGMPASTPYFDLDGYAKALFIKANPERKDFSVQVTERPLGNSMDFSAMEKFKWKVEEPVVGYEKPVDLENGKIALAPQMIRLFQVSYSAAMGVADKLHLILN